LSKYWSKLTKSLTPYVPGEQPKDKKYIKLNTNENPYPPSPKVLEAIRNAVNEDLKLYPDPNGDELKKVIADYHGISVNQVFVGNGSDEILSFAFATFFDSSEKVLFPDITYSFYPVYANFYNLWYKEIPLEEDFSLPLDKFNIPNGGIILANPNAPTSKYVSLDDLELLIKNNLEKVVILDEAYIDFGGESAIKLINKYPNLLVIHTLSKSRSLAGLRVGLAMGNQELIEGLNRVKNSFNSYTLDRLALAGAIAAYKDKEYFEKTRKKVMETRERTKKEMRALGFNVLDSMTNFIFASHPKVNGEKIFLSLKERGILVRYFNKPKIDNYIRISIGTDKEMDSLIKNLKEIII
jgi:histidinol-phosphate aminotransferase